jgi:hypothetical protein
MDGNFEDDFASMTIFISFPDITDLRRYAEDAENILQRLNDNPNLGPEPFVLTRKDGPELDVLWSNNRFSISMGEDDMYGDGFIDYTLVISGKDHGGPGNPATPEQETEFREHARQIVAAFQNPAQGARRRRNRRKTKKASKKRRSTKRR